ncbi:MAG: NUMOD4 motif-containing HNH endonuclease [Bacteroidales bacterium]
MKHEVWQDIPGYEDKYQASTCGRIRSLDRFVRGVCHFTSKEFYRKIKGRVLRPGQYCESGHISVVLEKGTPGKPVHKLVARTSLGVCPENCEVLHGNGNPKDNRVENLRYGTRTENILDVYKDGGRWRKLSIDDVETIRFALYCGFTGKELSEMYGVSQGTISKIKLRRTFAWLK